MLLFEYSIFYAHPSFQSFPQTLSLNFPFFLNFISTLDFKAFVTNPPCAFNHQLKILTRYCAIFIHHSTLLDHWGYPSSAHCSIDCSWLDGLNMVG